MDAFSECKRERVWKRAEQSGKDFKCTLQTRECHPGASSMVLTLTSFLALSPTYHKICLSAEPPVNAYVKYMNINLFSTENQKRETRHCEILCFAKNILRRFKLGLFHSDIS